MKPAGASAGHRRLRRVPARRSGSAAGLAPLMAAFVSPDQERLVARIVYDESGRAAASSQLGSPKSTRLAGLNTAPKRSG
jgi:hypothetical protein